MLKKINRLSKKHDFDLVFKQGKSVYSPYFVIKVLPNQLGRIRFGIVVSNKVSKRATKRNLIKRRIRAILQKGLKPNRQGIDVVILTSPRLINAQGKVLQNKQIEKELLAVLRKAKLFV